MIDINYAEEKMKQSYMKKEKKITNWDWELLNRQLNAIRNRLTKLEMRCEVDSEDIIMMNNKLNELEEENFNNTMGIERLEHSEDKEYLESIERCKVCEKLGINVKECRNYNNCKTKKFYEDIEKDLEERQSIYDETCERCSQFDTMTNECCVNANCKDEYLKSDKPKQDKNWIVHRTLRKKGRETYIGKSFLGINLNGFTYNVKEAKRFTIESAIALRDELNKQRIGKRFLWVVSKAKR